MPELSSPQYDWQARPEAGGRVAIWLLRHLPFLVGRSIARIITIPVALYFMARRTHERAASRAFLARVLGRRPTPFEVYRHFLYFSRVTLDRVYLLTDRFARFEVRTVGLEQLGAALDQGRGVLLFGSHLGSYDALRVLSLHNPRVRLRVLLDIGQNAELSRVLNALNPNLAASVIDARLPGPSLVLAMHDALAEGFLVATHVDRLRPGQPALSANFLGAPAAFPASPWQLAAVLRVPVVIAFGLYRGGRRYDLHFESFACELPADRSARQAALTEVAQRFADRLSHYARLAPYNWFNLYDFWDLSLAQDVATPGAAGVS